MDPEEVSDSGVVVGPGVVGAEVVLGPEVAVGPKTVDAEIILGPEVATGSGSVVGLAVELEPVVAVVVAVVVGGQVVRQAQRLPITQWIVWPQKTTADQ
jgi:hypothetical protein